MMANIEDQDHPNGVTLEGGKDAKKETPGHDDVLSRESCDPNEESASSKKVKKVTMTESSDQDIHENKGIANESHDVVGDAAELDDVDDATNMQMGLGDGKKKKKKSKKPKSKRGLNAPSGFEEYYVDAPLTPAEYDEEKQIYDSSFQFTQRIETAIQRFCAKRRLDSKTKDIFDKYLVNGGIDAGPKMFGGGLDAETLQNKNAAEIAELAATHYVDSGKVDTLESMHVVDFEGCLKAFLSGEVLDQWETSSEEQIQKLVGIIRNFLNYLLHHDVCPEYKDQIYAARSLCDGGAKELWNIRDLSSLLPGDFNCSCSEIFGGMYQGMHSENQSWMQEAADMGLDFGISPERARHVFKIGIAAHADDEMFSQYSQQLEAKSSHLIATEVTALEIIDIIHPNDNALALYGKKENGSLKILGQMKAKTWFVPNAPDEDLTEDEEAFLKANPPQAKEYQFWMEEAILEKCKVGMKLKATVRQTSFGLTYMDAIGGVFCSFYQLIPNQLMEGWREIEKEWLPMRADKYSAAGKEEGKVQDGSVKGDEGQDLAEAHGPGETDEGNQSVKQPEDEPDGFVVDTNLVAAGYDDDFEDNLAESGHGKENAVSDGPATEFGVEVHKAGEDLKEVAGNANRIVEKDFDVKRVEEID